MTKNLNFFNTLSNKKEKFVPIDSNKVGMYVCGPTVYDFPHIGNARPLVIFDVLLFVIYCYIRLLLIIPTFFQAQIFVA